MCCLWLAYLEQAPLETWVGIDERENEEQRSHPDAHARRQVVYPGSVGRCLQGQIKVRLKNKKEGKTITGRNEKMWRNHLNGTMKKILKVGGVGKEKTAHVLLYDLNPPMCAVLP